MERSERSALPRRRDLDYAKVFSHKTLEAYQSMYKGMVNPAVRLAVVWMPDIR